MGGPGGGGGYLVSHVLDAGEGVLHHQAADLAGVRGGQVNGGRASQGLAHHADLHPTQNTSLQPSQTVRSAWQILRYALTEYILHMTA